MRARPRFTYTLWDELAASPLARLKLPAGAHETSLWLERA